MTLAAVLSWAADEENEDALAFASVGKVGCGIDGDHSGVDEALTSPLLA